MCDTEQVEEGVGIGGESVTILHKKGESVPFGTSQKTEEYKRGNSRFTAGRTRNLILRFSFGKVAVSKKCRVLGQFCDSVFIL